MNFAEEMNVLAKNTNLEKQKEAYERAQAIYEGFKSSIEHFARLGYYQTSYTMPLSETCKKDREDVFIALKNLFIDKGFDGQHFITGLSEHLRNLMVALDPATHKLMEVSDSFRERFGEQAVNCGLALLLRYLDISSDYEYRYKEAGNKRLFIEVALMKMAALISNP